MKKFKVIHFFRLLLAIFHLLLVDESCRNPTKKVELLFREIRPFIFFYLSKKIKPQLEPPLQELPQQP